MPMVPVRRAARMHPHDRREQILAAALTLADRHGYLSFTRDQVAAEVGVSPGLITRYFWATVELRRHVMLRAIEERRLRIVAEGLAIKDATALEAPLELRQEAAGVLAC